MLRKILRRVGIALIILPEPFTTPVGIALLAASFCLPRGEQVDTYNRLRQFFKEYLGQVKAAHYSEYSERKALNMVVDHFWSHNWSNKPEEFTKIVHHSLKHESVYNSNLPEIVVNHPLKHDLPYGSTMPEIIYHTLNLDLPLEMKEPEAEKITYHALSGELPDEYRIPGPEKIVYHSLTFDLPEVYKVAEPEKIVYHALARLSYVSAAPETEAVVYHTLQYHLPDECIVAQPENVIQHSLKRNLSYELSETPEIVIHHTLRNSLPCQDTESKPEKVVHHSLRRDSFCDFRPSKPVIHRNLRRAHYEPEVVQKILQYAR